MKGEQLRSLAGNRVEGNRTVNICGLRPKWGSAIKKSGKNEKSVDAFLAFWLQQRFTLHNSTDSIQLIQLIHFIFIHEKEIHFAIRIL